MNSEGNIPRFKARIPPKIDVKNYSNACRFSASSPLKAAVIFSRQFLPTAFRRGPDVHDKIYRLWRSSRRYAFSRIMVPGDDAPIHLFAGNNEFDHASDYLVLARIQFHQEQSYSHPNVPALKPAPDRVVELTH